MTQHFIWLFNPIILQKKTPTFEICLSSPTKNNDEIPTGHHPDSMFQWYLSIYHGVANGITNVRELSASAHDHPVLGGPICKLQVMHHPSKELEMQTMSIIFLSTGTNHNISKSSSILKACGQILAQISSFLTWMMAALKPGIAHGVRILLLDGLFRVRFVGAAAPV